MIKLILKIAALTSVVLFCCLLMVNAPIKYKHGLAKIKNRFELLASKKNRKIVLVGGSGLSVGVDSECIARVFDYDVVNLGIYAGYGIEFLLEKSKQYLNPGDVVIVVPEFGSLFNRDLGATDKDAFKWLFVTDNYLAFKNSYLQDDNYTLILRDLSELFRDRVDALQFALSHKNFSSICGYGRIDNSDVNKYGDVTVHGFPKLNPSQFADHGIVYKVDDLRDSFIDKLNVYEEYFRKKHITLFFMYSCFPQEEYQLNQKQFAEIGKRLHNRLNVKVLGEPASFVFPSDYFSNTVNHLTTSGKAFRTEKMIEILSTKLPPMGRPHPQSKRIENTDAHSH